jgi:allantoin racemase
MLGHSFTIITTDEHSLPIHEELVRKYHLQEAMASVRAPGPESEKKDKKERFLLTAQSAVDRDRAEVIVLGCAGLTGMDKYLQGKLGVPVLDGIICALILVSGLTRYHKFKSVGDNHD